MRPVRVESFARGVPQHNVRSQANQYDELHRLLETSVGEMTFSASGRPPHVVASLRVGLSQKVHKKPEDIVWALTETLVACGSWFSGHVDTEPVRETMAGDYYGTALIRPLPRHRVINHRKWWTQPDYGQRVRGMYWGNYFGPELAQKLLSARGDEVEAVLASDRYERLGLRHFPNGGIFITFAKSPVDLESSWTIADNDLDPMIAFERILRQEDLII